MNKEEFESFLMNNKFLTELGRQHTNVIYFGLQYRVTEEEKKKYVKEAEDDKKRAEDDNQAALLNSIHNDLSELLKDKSQDGTKNYKD